MNTILINPVFSDHDPYCPPLGLGYIAAVLIQKKIPVSIIDMNVENLDMPILISKIEEAHPDIVGLSSTVRNADSAIELSREISNLRIPVVHGGSDPSVDPEKYLRANPKSLVLRGEAEYSFAELTKEILHGQSHHNIPGLSFSNGETFVHVTEPTTIKNLDILPFPARHLFHMERYTARLGRRKATSIMGSRSCPYKCIFCHTDKLPKHRQRSPENILLEVKSLIKEYNYKGFYFYDCTFTTNKSRVIEFCNLLIEEKLDIEWQCMSRVDQLDIETMHLMRQAGCVRVAVGAESGSERSLQLMKKGINTHQIERFFENLKSAGIRTRGYFVLGFPWETPSDFQSTFDLVKRICPDEVAVSFATPLPGTELHKMVSGSHQLIIHNNSQLMGLPAFIPSGFSEQDLFKYRELINEFVEKSGGSL